jgi:hypothetical protein
VVSQTEVSDVYVLSAVVINRIFRYIDHTLIIEREIGSNLFLNDFGG